MGNFGQFITLHLIVSLCTRMFHNKMNVKQLIALNEVKNGHNLLLLGQSGTGKSHLVCTIEQELKKGEQREWLP